MVLGNSLDIPVFAPSHKIEQTAAGSVLRFYQTSMIDSPVTKEAAQAGIDRSFCIHD
jgi:hypothetical protein